MSKTLNYFLGKSRVRPGWVEYLPDWALPICVGQDRFRWFGAEIQASRGQLDGETLFMYIRRIKAKKGE